MDLRTAAREIFLEALHSLDIRSTLRRRIRTHSTRLYIDATTFDLNLYPDILLIAIGKAALPMTEGLLEVLQPALPSAHRLRGIVVGTALPSTPDPRLLYRLGSHPLPDQTSAEAARRILHLLGNSSEGTLVLFLLSGGASSMVELPLDPSLPLHDLIAFHKTLVHSGLSIAGMNTLRKHLSAVKGGRLATAAPTATKCTLLLSDVRPSQPDIIGSGPSLPDASTLDDCRGLLSTRLRHAAIPASIQTLIASPATPETPKPGHPAFRHATHHTLLSSDDLAAASSIAAQNRGFQTVIDQTPDEWPLSDASAYLLDRLHASALTHPTHPTCLISTGEISLPITTPHPGLGGRNQHFALHCALHIADIPHRSAVLSAGSDGVDGNSPAAGAIVDNTTLQRAVDLGLNPSHALAGFNSYPLLHSLGDTIITGPTGNNLRDLRLLLVDPTQPQKPGSHFS